MTDLSNAVTAAPSRAPADGARRTPAEVVVTGDRGGRFAFVAGLLFALSRKNFQVRYKRATLGVLWAVIQPAFYALVLSLIFTRVVPIEGIDHYLLYVLSGTIPWTFFTASLSASTTAVVDNGPLVKKVALPQLVFPLAAIGGVGMAFSASLTILVVIAALSGAITTQVALLPLAVGLQLALLAGAGAVTSSLHVAYRDVKYIVESLVLVGFYATPVFYDVERLDGILRLVISLNPMTGILMLYRGALLGRDVVVADVVSSFAMCVLLLGVGFVLFRRRSPDFADLV